MLACGGKTSRQRKLNDVASSIWRDQRRYVATHVEPGSLERDALDSMTGCAARDVNVDATSRPAMEADSEELTLDGTCSATRCRSRASLPTDAGYGPRGEARADARDCLYCGWARRALSVRDTGH